LVTLQDAANLAIDLCRLEALLRMLDPIGKARDGELDAAADRVIGLPVRPRNTGSSGLVSHNQGAQYSHGLAPESAEAPFVVLAEDPHRRGGAELQVADDQPGRFVCSRTGVVQEQKQCMVASSEGRTPIRYLHQSVQLCLFEVPDNRAMCRYPTSLPPPLHASCAVVAHQRRPGR
jgi:hypothetical protein